MIAHIDHVTIVVRDIAKAKGFFSLLGFVEEKSVIISGPTFARYMGVEGIEAIDNGVDRDGIKTYGALGIGGLKMKLHKACIAKLFERNDLVLDAESILEVAQALS